MTTNDDRHRASVHRLKAQNHLKAAALLEGRPLQDVPEVPAPPVVPTTTPATYPPKPKPGQSKAEIDAFVAACNRRNSSIR